MLVGEKIELDEICSGLYLEDCTESVVVLGPTSVRYVLSISHVDFWNAAVIHLERVIFGGGVIVSGPPRR